MVLSEIFWIRTRTWISLNPQYPTSWGCHIFKELTISGWDLKNPKILNIQHPEGVMFSEMFWILTRTQISLNPQNTTSWGVVFSEIFWILTRTQISLNPQYPTSLGCHVFKELTRSGWDLKNPQILNIQHPEGVMVSEIFWF